MIKAFIHVMRSIMRSLAKQFKDPHSFPIMKLEKFVTGVYFTNSLNHLPQRHYDKKASIETTIGHCGVTIASCRLMCRWRDNRSTF